MVRVADGERDAFRGVFDGLWPLLLAFCRRGLDSEADAEDAAQRALLKVSARIVDLDRERDGVAWALTIASFEILTVRAQRRRRREEGSVSQGDVRGPGPTPEEEAIARNLHAAVLALVGQLSERDQQALHDALRGKSGTDDTSRKRRLRAFDRLRDAWRKLHG
ncbi:MAG: sigma-70 family RNA polymerase sigma factor [Pseudomonadota bacterium]|nr:sigma-70 family RNA polymerase sigma factor [Pseudomonadota bacterium]